MLKHVLQLSVNVGFVRGVKRKQRYRMFARQLAQDVVAADFPTGIRRNQATSFNPEDLHGGNGLPANPFIGAG